VRSRRLTRLADEATTVRPSWSPDGGRIAYAARGGVSVVRVRDGATETLRNVRDEEVREVAWSPDGRWVAFTVSRVPED
jgi:Tol biopolymer transport system component